VLIASFFRLWEKLIEITPTIPPLGQKHMPTACYTLALGIAWIFAIVGLSAIWIYSKNGSEKRKQTQFTHTRHNLENKDFQPLTKQLLSDIFLYRVEFLNHKKALIYDI